MVIENIRPVRFGLRSKFLLAFALVFTGYGAVSSTFLLRYFFDDKARYVLFSLHQGAEALCGKLSARAHTPAELTMALRQFDSASGFVFQEPTGNLLAEHGLKDIAIESSDKLWKFVQENSDHGRLPNFTVEHKEAGTRYFLSACRTERSEWLLLVVDANLALRPAQLLLFQMGGLFIALLGIGFVVFWLLARGLTKPLEQLAAAADDLGAGNYHTTLNIPNQDELGALADSFSLLSTRLNLRESELEKTTELASRDFLTGLWNRRYGDRRLEEIFLLAKRHKRDLSVVYLDVDFFKKINDTEGHAAGDEVLKDFGFIMKAQMRNTDIVVRVGGEEFMLILPETALDGALIAAQKVRLAVKAHGFLGARALKMTASFGVASIDSGSFQSAQELIAAADKLCYKSKTTGRDRIHSARGQLADS